MSTLFIKLDTPDRSRTQTMYAANYFPRRELGAAKKLICWAKRVMLYKEQVLNALTEDMAKLNYAPSTKAVQQWNIHWVFNAIPTQLEWERKSDGFVIEVEFRVLVEGTKIALLSL